MKILLLDMDGTLLTPNGYHLALQETVTITGRVLGYENVHLTTPDITAFEAAGVISEWDSTAICAAMLLDSLFQEDPNGSLPPSLPSEFRPLHNIPHPNFRAFAEDLGSPELGYLDPLARAQQLLMDKANARTPEQNKALSKYTGNRTSDGRVLHSPNFSGVCIRK